MPGRLFCRKRGAPKNVQLGQFVAGPLVVWRRTRGARGPRGLGISRGGRAALRGADLPLQVRGLLPNVQRPSEAERPKSGETPGLLLELRVQAPRHPASTPSSTPGGRVNRPPATLRQLEERVQVLEDAVARLVRQKPALDAPPPPAPPPPDAPAPVPGVDSSPRDRVGHVSGQDAATRARRVWWDNDLVWDNTTS